VEPPPITPTGDFTLAAIHAESVKALKAIQRIEVLSRPASGTPYARPKR